MAVDAKIGVRCDTWGAGWHEGTVKKIVLDAKGRAVFYVVYTADGHQQYHYLKGHAQADDEDEVPIEIMEV